MSNTDRKKYYWLLLNTKETKEFKKYLDARDIYYETVKFTDPAMGKTNTRFGCLMHIGEAEAAAHWLQLFRGGRKTKR